MSMTTTGSNAMTPTNMESAIKLAEMMARGKLVPEHLHNSPGDCLMVVEQALRWQMSPFAVAQCTSVIQGKLMFEGKLVAAALNASGVLASRLDYEFNGENGKRAVTVTGTLRGETKPRAVIVRLEEAKTSNGMWTKQPDQQLVYAGTRVWARRHAPEVMLGVYAPEEFEATQPEPFSGPTIDHTNDDKPAKAAAARVAPAPRVTDPTTYEPPRKTVGQLLTATALALKDARNRAEADAILDGDTWQKLEAHAKGEARERLEEIRASVEARFPLQAPATTRDDVPDWIGGDLEIAGAEKMAAG